MHEDILLQLDFIHLAQFLTRLPENICQQELFTHVAAVRMTSSSDNRTFSEVLASHKDSVSKATSVTGSCLSVQSSNCDVAQGTTCPTLPCTLGVANDCKIASADDTGSVT